LNYVLIYRKIRLREAQKRRREMNAHVTGNSSYSHVQVYLNPGETVIAESGAMVPMSEELDIKAITNGGFCSALGKKIFGGESFSLHRFTNIGPNKSRLTLSQDIPGEILKHPMTKGEELNLRRGAYLAHRGELKLTSTWAGMISYLSGEGLIKLKVKAKGPGTLFLGAYGSIVERDVEGDLKVKKGYLIAFDPHLKLRPTLPGGVLKILLGDGDSTTRVVGTGRVYLQTRSIRKLTKWLNPS
jgi:uncharacterized protein (TIGR00266 family)